MGRDNEAFGESSELLLLLLLLLLQRDSLAVARVEEQEEALWCRRLG